MSTSDHASISAEDHNKRTEHSQGDRPASGDRSETHENAGEKDESASHASGSMAAHLKEMLDHQIASGCGAVGALANSAMRAAGDLDKDSPQLAGFVREAATRLNGAAKGMQGRTVEELVSTASVYTRRQPALVFGLAALAGFLALRTVKAASQSKSPNRAQGRGGHAHG